MYCDYQWNIVYAFTLKKFVQTMQKGMTNIVDTDYTASLVHDVWMKILMFLASSQQSRINVSKGKNRTALDKK